MVNTNDRVMGGTKPSSLFTLVLFELLAAGLKLFGSVLYRYPKSRPSTLTCRLLRCSFSAKDAGSE